MALHGLLLVHKPADITSHDVVKKIRHALKLSSVGHAGTLDPLATGLMVILLGEGTKLSDYILNGDKSYKMRVKLGIRTDTLDVTGTVQSSQEVNLDPDRMAHEAQKLQGDFVWPVPIFSAVKVNGKKLYSYARQDEAPQRIPNKEMKFWNLNVLNVGTDFIEAHIDCSKGSFIRSWAAELGERLGVGGALESLERTSSKPYFLTSAMALSEVTSAQGVDTPAWKQAFIPLEESLSHWPTFTVKGKDERLIHNGQISYDLERRMIVEVKTATLEQRTIHIKLISAETGLLLAIVEALPNQGVKVRRVFKMS